MTTRTLLRKWNIVSQGLSVVACAVLTGGVLFLGGCTDNVSPSMPGRDTPTNTPGDDDAGNDPSPGPGSDDAGSNDAANPRGPVCVSSFGDELTTGFGRIDGTLVGIARPQDRSCAQANSTHVALEIAFGGQNYIMFVNVQSDQGPPDVYFAEKSAPMPGAAWSEGWHSDATLSYQDDLDTHSEDFKSYDTGTLTDKIISELSIGKKISVYATAYGPDGGHDVHKEYGYTTDGAVVVDPDSANAKIMMFRFDDSPQF